MGRLEQLAKNKRMKEVIKLDKRLLEACNDLRQQVENPTNDSEIIMEQGIYKRRNPEAIMTIRVDGVVVGYKVKESSKLEMNPYYDRYCYIRTPDHRLSDLTAKEMAVIKYTVLEAFFEPQQGNIHTEVIGDGAILMTQRFMVAFPYKFQDATIQVPQGFNG
jgi:hypothetical protein